VVRNYTFPYGWGIYRIEPIPLRSVDSYDGTMHTSEFKINLSTLNTLAGVEDIYYKINNGTTKSVNVDGQPMITTQGTNNTLEYWSVDKTGIEEKPHRILTGIGLIPNTTSTLMQRSSSENSWENSFLTVGIAVILVVTSVYLLRIRRRQKASMVR